MNQKEYLVESERTLNYAFNANDPEVQVLNHGMIGLVTEVGELVKNVILQQNNNPINVAEELGDISWYIAIFQRRYPVLLMKPYMKIGGHPDVTLMQLSVDISELADDFKRLIYYGKPPKNFKGTTSDKTLLECYEDSIISKVTLIQQTWVNLVWQLDLDPEKIYAINIAKLRGRLGTSFDAEAVFNRDLDKENTIMNQTNQDEQ